MPFVSSMAARELRRAHPALDRAGMEAMMRADLGASVSDEDERFIAEVLRKVPARESGALEPGNDAWRSPSVLMLIASNLLPLYAVVAWGWPAIALLALFWLENVVIGVLNAARMLAVDPGNLALWGGKLLLVPFFCLHYGLFTAVHGQFVFALFGGEAIRGSGSGLWPGDSALQAIVQYGLAVPLAALAASHVFSFFYNYLWRGEFRVASVARLMMQPYSRIVVLHIAILAGGVLAMSLGAPVWALALLAALKVGLDLRAHVQERRRNRWL